MHIQYQSDTTPQTHGQLLQTLLKNRNITDTDFFKTPSPASLSLKEVGIDPQQLNTAVDRILQAITNKEKITIVGDYDADGVCATAVLWQTLNALGAHVLPFIPDREKHGYGLSTAVLEEVVAEQQPSLVITVDNGIVAHEAVKAAQAQGMDVIVTDHHTTDEQHSPAQAVVHSTKLCGASVAWMVAREVVATSESDYAVQELLDLVGIATIADQVPLTGANRVFAVAGIAQLKRSTRPGITALFSIAGGSQDDADEGTIGFVLGPRINAAGRMGDATQALRLLCTTSSVKAKQLAATLHMLNSDRRAVTSQLYESLTQQLEDQRDAQVIVLEVPAGVEGIIGLVAGQVCERYHKPTIVVTTTEQGKKGSARSVKGVHISEFMRTAAELLESVGGHELAGGFSAIEENWPAVRTLWATEAAKIDPHLLQKTITVECKLADQLLSIDTVTALQKLGPFGAANPVPIFALPEITVEDLFYMGADKQHVRLKLRTQEGTKLQAVWWRGAEHVVGLEAHKQVDAVGTLTINTWKNRQSLQFELLSLNAH